MIKDMYVKCFDNSGALASPRHYSKLRKADLISILRFDPEDED